MPAGSASAGDEVGVVRVSGEIRRDVGALRHDLEPLGPDVIERSPDEASRVPLALERRADPRVDDDPTTLAIAVVELADLFAVHQEAVLAEGSVVLSDDLDLHGSQDASAVPASLPSRRPPGSYDLPMLLRSFRPLVLVAAVAAALLAGCGTSSGSDAADGTTTSAADDGATTVVDEASTTEAEDATTTRPEATTTAAPDDDAICGPLKALSASDAEANRLVATGDWPKIKAFYVDQTDDIIAIYDEAIALDTEITADLEALRSVTVSAGKLAEASSSLMDFSGKLMAQPGLSESSQAALRASAFSEDTCGFALAGF